MNHTVKWCHFGHKCCASFQSILFLWQSVMFISNIQWNTAKKLKSWRKSVLWLTILSGLPGMVSQTQQVYMVIYSLLIVVCAKIVNITALASKEEAGGPHRMLVIFTTSTQHFTQTALQGNNVPCYNTSLQSSATILFLWYINQVLKWEYGTV